MKIHIVIYVHTTHESKRLNLPVGGISSVILELLPVYEKNKDIEITLVTKYSEYEPISERAKINVIFKFLVSQVNTLYFFLKSFYKITKIHKKNPIHAINIHTFYYDLITPLLLRIFFKIPLLIKPPSDFITQQRELFMTRPHNIFTRMTYYGWMKFFRKYVVKLENVFFQAINKKIYKDLLALGIPRKKIAEIPNGISINKYLGLKKYDHIGTRFGFVGRLLKSKNIRFLLRAFSNYLSKYPKDKLFIFGQGPEEKFISKFIAKYNLSENIILWGFERNKKKIYSNIDVLIHPTFGEGCPNTILESILTGIFVIASKVSGIKDIIDHKISGLLFNPFKEMDLLNQLMFYKHHQELAQKIIERAKEKVIKDFDVNVVANKIYNFLRSKWIIKACKECLKISILTPVFPHPIRGKLPGIERYVESLVIPLKNLGSDVKIVTTFWNGGKKNEIYKNIPILRIFDSRALIGKLGSIFHLNNITFGLNLIRRKNFKFYCDSDIIILPLALGFSSFFKIKKIPTISIFHHYDTIYSFMEYLTVPFYHFIEKRQLKIHGNIIAVSNASKKKIIERYGIPHEKITVIPNGVNTKMFNPLNESKNIRKKLGNNVLLFVGPFINRKRIPVLLKAMPYIIRKVPDVHLILIGEGILWNYCKKLAVLLKIQNHTSFLGFIENKEVIKIYASCDMFIFPSEKEGFGQVILEAMASGLPVICANIPPMSEIIENGGKTFELNDSIDLSKKICELLSDREELNILKKNALEIAKRYDLTNIATKYFNYFKIISEKFSEKHRFRVKYV